jgi:hypothetical protein
MFNLPVQFARRLIHNPVDLEFVDDEKTFDPKEVYVG